MAGLALAPLSVARRVDAAAAMAGWRSSGLPSAGRMRERLLIAQMALTVVLLATGALPERTRAIPGVREAAVATSSPLCLRIGSYVALMRGPSNMTFSAPCCASPPSEV